MLYRFIKTLFHISSFRTGHVKAKMSSNCKNIFIASPAHVMKIAPDLPSDHIICMNMCGRGDKDIFTVARHLGFDMSGPEGRNME
jgi:hypothetical protein